MNKFMHFILWISFGSAIVVEIYEKNYVAAVWVGYAFLFYCLANYEEKKGERAWKIAEAREDLYKRSLDREIQSQKFLIRYRRERDFYQKTYEEEIVKKDDEIRRFSEEVQRLKQEVVDTLEELIAVKIEKLAGMIFPEIAKVVNNKNSKKNANKQTPKKKTSPKNVGK